MKKFKFIFLFVCLLSAFAASSQTDVNSWTRNISAPFSPSQGLSGRHICVWASHGRYFDTKAPASTPRDSLFNGTWRWQRPYLFCTTEDLLTPSIVYPFFIPMLENAGAIVWTPRERDMQTHMTLVEAPTRQTSRQYEWRAKVDTIGSYAVYVRYPKLADAVPDAIYTIHHGGERTRIAVNQRMGADTWVYLGTFAFNPAIYGDGLITLSKETRYRGHLSVGSVRLGGGMGHIARFVATPADSLKSDTTAIPQKPATTSGLPHYLEAARYWAEWAGLPDSLYNSYAGTDDYKDDLRTRGNFLNHLIHEQNVPFSLSLALHTDAGYRPDSIPYGSLAICTSKGDDGTTLFPDSTSRTVSRNFCHLLISSLMRDLADLNWQQRGERDDNYAETRMPHVPSAIIEMLSHQNFTDMRLAHDPLFKFRLARAIYKAIVRYLGATTIEPLPVHSYAAILHGDEALLSWSATPDSLEPSALPTHYIIYTRLDDGDFDNGQITTDTLFRQPITPGHRYTFRIQAANDGGLSFPSHQLTVYKAPIPTPVKAERHEHKSASHTSPSPEESAQENILLVDAFTRLSGPAFISTPDSVGFLMDADPGVPYGATLEYCGAQLGFSPSHAGKEGPGALGYSSNEMEGKPLRGNTFDIAAQRAASLVLTDSLVNISSACADALPSLPSPADDDALLSPSAIYYLAGKQRRAPHNMADFPVWPEAVRPYIKKALHADCLLHVEGAYIQPSALSPDEREWWENITEKYANVALQGFSH